MSTRYAMPPCDRGNEEGADLARRARGIVALVLVIGLMAIMLWAATVPPDDAPVVVAPQAEASPLPLAGVLPGA